MSGSVMDELVKFNSQTAGRDRLFRLFQYGSRFVWAYLEKHSHDKDTINKLKNLEYSLSTARKLFRFGRSIDTFYGALNTIHLQDSTLRYTLTLSRINMALYLMSDHILWIGRVGLLNINKNKWSRISYKLWLYYLVMNLTRDVYEIVRIINMKTHGKLSTLRKGMKYTPDECSGSKLWALYNIILQHKDVTLDTIKNGCDIWLPLSQLGYANLSPGLVGLLGVISSIAGILPIVDHSCKLMPS